MRWRAVPRKEPEYVLMQTGPLLARLANELAPRLNHQVKVTWNVTVFVSKPSETMRLMITVPV